MHCSAPVIRVCMEEMYGDYFIIYKVSKRTGVPITMTNESFDLYIRKIYAELSESVNNQRRMILPGVDEYNILCVSKLKDNLGTVFEKRLNNAIIIPLETSELKDILKSCANENDVKSRFENEIEENESYSKILDYIKEYRSNKGVEFDKETVYKSYMKLILHLWKVLKPHMQ